MFKFLLPLDLQLFADEFGSYDPASAYEGIPTQPEGEQVQPEGQGEVPPSTEPVATEPQLLDFGGRKLQASEELMGLHKDYTEQQRYMTSLQETVNAYKQGAVKEQPQEQPQTPEISADVRTWSEENWAQFYEKPEDVIGGMINSAVQKFATERLEPIIQERQWNQEIQGMYDRYPDFDQFVGEVQGLVNQYPERYGNREGGLEEAYFRSKATTGGTNQNPAQLAKDPQFLQDYVLNNPTVQSQVVGQYLQNKQQTNTQLPPSMGRGGGGFVPQTPDNSPQNLKEASRAFMKTLGQR